MTHPIELPALTGDELPERREVLGLSAPQLARRAGVTRMTVWRVENGVESSVRIRRLLTAALELEARP